MLTDGAAPWLPRPQQVTKKSFKFAQQYDLPFFFVSAADGTNVVQVTTAPNCVATTFSRPPTLTDYARDAQVFHEAIRLGAKFKQENPDFMTEVMELLK
jgi:hypothetical protein